MSPRRVSLLLFVVGLALTGCDITLPGQPKPGDMHRRPEDVLDFDTLFATNCSGCHGEKGEIGPAPPLNDPRFLAIFSEQMTVEIISQGRMNTLMPAFSRANDGPLTEKQVEIIAAGIRSRWADPNWTEKTPAYAGTSQGDKERGGAIFGSACATCHGEDGKAGALDDQAFLALASDQLLRRMIITGRSDLGMPAWNGRAEPLTTEQIDDVVALMKSWRRPLP